MKEIILYPAKILREKLLRVERVDKELIEDMADLDGLLEKSENGAGLAATQIGSKKRFFGLKNSKTKKVDVFINPTIVKSKGEKVYPILKSEEGGEEDFLEGCLSFPDYFGTVKRFLEIEAEWEEVEGKNLIKKTKRMKGFEAIVFQHEADHLDGVLFVDHIKRDGGKFFKWVEKDKISWNVDKVIEGKL